MLCGIVCRADEDGMASWSSVLLPEGCGVRCMARDYGMLVSIWFCVLVGYAWLSMWLYSMPLFLLSRRALLLLFLLLLFCSSSYSSSSRSSSSSCSRSSSRCSRSSSSCYSCSCCSDSYSSSPYCSCSCFPPCSNLREVFGLDVKGCLRDPGPSCLRGTYY